MTACAAALELWGGVECTVNRVGDRFFDQLERAGHLARAGDLDRIAALGIRTLRYPVLWEHVAPESPDTLDWARSDERLSRLRELGVRPIVGLVHHGSGPRWTSLIDPTFPERLAAYAERVAERYPWVTDFTPVNEPLTTARFSGLYGHWFPHGQSTHVFARCLIHQCAGIVRAMRAIRRVTPAARLVHTDDLGRVHATPRLAYQAEFENERRWLSFDLVMGRVDRAHPLWPKLTGWGIGEDELDWFLERACPPDVIGINHYLTSDRYLDEDLARYPTWSHGGNGTDRYADVHAVIARVDVPVDTEAALRDAWARYGRTLAVTEAQLAGPREEQLRWLHEVWTAASRLRDEGVDVCAVTAWSLLGAYDWNQLVTVEAGFYENGAFDLRAPSPRPTALARLVSHLATGAPFDEPVVHAPGWWRRPDRTLPAIESARDESPPPEMRPILVCGASGTLARAIGRVAERRGIASRVIGRPDLDITDRASLERALERWQPWAVINAAGYVRVDDAEHERERCFRSNTRGAELLAQVCAAHGLRLMTYSSDLVFDGHKDAPYVESDRTAPLNVYGRSKALAERRVLKEHPGALVIRTAAFFGPWDDASFVARALDALGAGKRWSAASDLVVSPTYVLDLAHASLDLLIDRERGIWHLANDGALTWAELARRAAVLSGLPADAVDARSSVELAWPAARPNYAALGSERGLIMPSLDDALSRFVRDRDEA
ncbi:sugar nucleotide-binding protein [Sandaracinus amylolyticus]|uniref:dTDP-4-dehydrorhamnose reductase n=1 Tax=Sandaracinus amylolyticus TaxID=927083 RepID=A0A0F6VZT6_9BACT|nr:sugar nucleotide-binding protein [Sandaracinus amylolyticus]AKF03843.1 dTDP-4-dehydrorhamnose reductase [Sandaracinus amylolyticus]